MSLFPKYKSLSLGLMDEVLGVGNVWTGEGSGKCMNGGREGEMYGWGKGGRNVWMGEGRGVSIENFNNVKDFMNNNLS